MFQTKYFYSEVIRVEKNSFVKLYEFFSTRRIRKPFSYIHYFLGLLFNRVAFELVRFLGFLPLTAKLGSQTFTLNCLNSQVSSVFLISISPATSQRFKRPCVSCFREMASLWTLGLTGAIIR